MSLAQNTLFAAKSRQELARFHLLDPVKQPALGVTPVALHGAFGQIQDLSNFRLAEPGEETQFNYLSLLGGLLRKFV
jgi:hypothetical protein